MMMFECNHVYVDDYVSGTQVCICCGLVADTVLYGEEVARRPLEEEKRREPRKRKTKDDEGLLGQLYYDVVLREFLFDTLAPVHMDCAGIIDRTIGTLYQIAMEDDRKSFYLNLSVRNIRDRGRLAYVTWETLKADKCPRAPQELAILFNTCTTFMRSAEKELDRQPTYSHLSDYAQRLCGELHVPSWCVSAVEEACWHAESFNSVTVPEHTVGAIILELGRVLRTNLVGLNHSLTAASIATIVGCSEQRIERLHSQLPLSVEMALWLKLFQVAKRKNLKVNQLACELALRQASHATPSIDESMLD